MDISYSYENVNILIVLIGFVLIIHIATLRKIEKRTIKFSNYEILKRVIGYDILYKNYLPLILRLMAMFLIIVGISNLTISIITLVSDTDYVFAIDSSSSMLTSDNGTFELSRLESAKESAINIIDKLPANTNIGIVTFAGKSYIKTEPINDHRKIKEIIHGISFDSTAGTAIGDALVSSAGILSNSSNKRVMTLITDGRKNMGIDIDESLKYVKINNITVNTIGVGLKNITLNITSESGLPVDLEGKNATALEFQQLNESELKYIANETNGRYFFVTNKEELDKAFETAVLEKDIKNIPLVKYVLLLASFLLLIEWALGATKYKTIP
ncbi:MAG: VWA domain-containing protein [archaeon]